MVTTNNSSLFQKTQLGMQANFGTAVPATKVLKAMGFELGPSLETNQYSPDGNLFPSGSDIIQEWTEGDLTGVLTYTEIIYALHMLLGPPDSVPVETAIGSGAYEWIWTVGAQKEIVPVYATIEKGRTGAGNADRAVGAVLTGLGINWSRTDAIELEGTLLAKALEYGATLTTIGANATVPTLRVLPPHVSVFVSDDYADLTDPVATATRLLRAFEASVSLDSLFSAVWPLNAAVTGHDGIVATRPDSESSLLIQADAQGRSFLANTRAGDTDYVAIHCQGPEITAGVNNLFQVDMAVQVSDVDTYEDSDGIYAIPWTFQPIDDGTNPPLRFRVINSLSAL